MLGIIHLNWSCLWLVTECEIRDQQRNFFSSIFNDCASEMFDSYVMKSRPSLQGDVTPPEQLCHGIRINRLNGLFIKLLLDH